MLIYVINIHAGAPISVRVGGGIPAPRPTPLFIMKD
jgi:hypothetical protein